MPVSHPPVLGWPSAWWVSRRPNRNSHNQQPRYNVYTTEAFDHAVDARSVLFETYLIKLRQGAADLPSFQSQAHRLGALGDNDLDTEASAVTSSIHPQAVGWWILAGPVELIVVGQALARQATVESDTFATLSALGVSRRQLVMEGMARTLAVGVVGVTGRVLLACLPSPLTPVGEARLADPDPGFTVDTFILLPGTLVAIPVVLALGLWPAMRALVVANMLAIGPAWVVARSRPSTLLRSE